MIAAASGLDLEASDEHVLLRVVVDVERVEVLHLWRRTGAKPGPNDEECPPEGDPLILGWRAQ